MRADEFSRIYDAVGGSAMHLSLTETWGVIVDLAESTKQRPMHQTDEKAPTVEVDPMQNEPSITPIASLPAANTEGDINTRAVMDMEAALKEPTLEPTKLTEDEDTESSEEEPIWDLTPEPSEDLEPETDIVWDEEEPIWDITPEPSEVMDESDTESIEEESSWELTTEAEEEIKPGPVLIAKPAEPLEPVLITNLLEKDPILMADKPLLNPSVSMQITAPDDDVVKNAVLGELEVKHEPKQPTMEHSFATSPKNSLVLGRPFITAMKKRIGMGTCLRSFVTEGRIQNFQNCKDANRSDTKKRPRHGTFEWKPGLRNKRARLKKPAATIERTSPFRKNRKKRKNRKEKPPEPWELDPHTSSKKSGKGKAKSNTGTVAKFDLSHPWDPNQ